MCWVAAGLPIIVTSLQALLALFGVDADDVPVMATLKSTFQAIEVFDEAGVIFRDNDIVVFGLFLLIALAWVGVGVAMLVLRDRQLTYAGAGLVTVFLALFLLVYSPLFTGGTPVVQLLGFLAIPVLTVVTIWLGVSSYEWAVTLEEETAERLATAREQARDAQETFDQRVRRELDTDTLAQLETVAPDVVATFEATVETFETECEGLRTDAQQLAETAAGLSTRERRERAIQLADRAASLDPVAQAERALETLRQDLVREVQSTYNEVAVTSSYGDRYIIRNMDGFNEVVLPGVEGPPIQIGGEVHELDDRLAALLEPGTGVSLSEGTRAVTQAASHIQDMEATLRHNEERFDARRQEVESELASARDALDRLDSRVGERLEEMLFEGRFGDEQPPFPTSREVHRQLEDATAQLHECRFERALRTLDQAHENAEQLRQTAVFVADSVVPTIQHGSGTVAIPTTVETALVERLRVELTRVYDIDYTVENDTIEIHPQPVDETAVDTTTVNDEADTGPSRHQRPSEQASSNADYSSEDVLYLLRELRRNADEYGADRSVTLQLGEYPTRFSSDPLLDEIRTFCERQTEIRAVDVDNTDPGYIELTVNEEESPVQVLSALCERY